jgi:hypothetical protein
MKKQALLVLFVLAGIGLSSGAGAYWVDGYYTSDGSYTNGYYRTPANGLRYDNYSYDGGDLYNQSYGSYGASWDTPAWYTDDSYYTGQEYYNSYNNTYDEYYQNDYYEDYSGDYYYEY